MADHMLATIELNEKLQRQADALSHDLSRAFRLTFQAQNILRDAQGRDLLGNDADVDAAHVALQAAADAIEGALIKITRSGLRIGGI